MKEISKKYLVNNYLTKKLSTIKIAKKTGMTFSSIRNKLIMYGIPRRTKVENARNHLEDLTNKRFGKLFVIKKIEEIPPTDFMSKWLCQCECGKTKIIRGRSLRKGHTKSCGCSIFTGFEEISGTYWNSVIVGAKTRNLPFSISMEYAWDLFLKQNRKCSLTNDILILKCSRKNFRDQTASLDRIDSTKGYIEGNVQWVHKYVNIIKWDFSEKEFLDIVKKIYINKIQT